MKGEVVMGLLDIMNGNKDVIEKQAFDNSQTLSREEEKNLALEYQKTGDKLVYQKLLMSLRPMVESEINKAAQKHKHVPREVFGLDAYSRLPGHIKKFDPTAGTQLNTFLTPSISGNLTNLSGEFMDGVFVDRTEKYNLRKYQDAVKMAKMEFGPNPTDEQVKKHLQPVLHNRFEDLKRTDVKSYIGDATHGEDEDKQMEFKEMFRDNSGDYDAENSFDVGFQDLKDLAKKQLNFTDKDNKIVEDVLVHKNPIASVALTHGTSSSTVANRVKDFRKMVNGEEEK
jgi:DNA-directed RNA polymerase specialized sigma subunit